MFTLSELQDLKNALAGEIERMTEGDHYESQDAMDNDLTLYAKVQYLIKESE